MTFIYFIYTLKLRKDLDINKKTDQNLMDKITNFGNKSGRTDI